MLANFISRRLRAAWNAWVDMIQVSCLEAPCLCTLDFFCTALTLSCSIATRRPLVSAKLPVMQLLPAQLLQCPCSQPTVSVLNWLCLLSVNPLCGTVKFQIHRTHSAGAAYASQCSWQRAAAHPQPVTEPGSVHCMGVLDAVPPPAQGLQGNCQQDQEQGRLSSLQCLEGPSNAAGESQAAVQTSPWRVSAQLLCCLGVSHCFLAHTAYLLSVLMPVYMLSYRAPCQGLIDMLMHIKAVMPHSSL